MFRKLVSVTLLALTLPLPMLPASAADCVLSDPSETYAGTVAPPPEPGNHKITGAEVRIYVDLDNCKVLGVDRVDPSKKYTVDWIKPDPAHACDTAHGCYIVKILGVPYCRCP